MSSIGKVHLNGSTVLSLNDRFTIMQKQGGNSAPMQQRPRPRPRPRSRSRSRSRYVPQMAQAAPVAPRISIRNRSLLQQLDQKHKMRVALKLKRKSMKIKPQNAIGIRGRRRLIRPSAAMNNPPNSRRHVRRSNSVAKQIATIKADLIKNVKRVRRLTKSNSTLNLNDQLGVRGRPRLRRNNAIGERAASRSRGRSASRNRANLSRTNLPRNNLPRNNLPRNNITRTNSTQNVRGRSASRQRQGAPIHLNRSNSRINLRGQNIQQRPQNVARRSRSQSRTRKNTSVNARLGVRRQNVVGQRQRPVNNQGRQPNNLRNVQRGRVTKRPNQNPNNRIRNGAQQQQQQQNLRGRSRSRVRQNVGRSQSRTRNPTNGPNGPNGRRNGPNQQRRINNPKNQQRGGNQIRGRLQKKNVKREPPKSKEQLDAELDQYMVNTKSSLDQEMSIYTK